MARRGRSNRNRYSHGRIWDDAGQIWEAASGGWLSRARVLELLVDPEVPVGVHVMWEGISWVPAAHRRRYWAREVEPFFQGAGDDDAADEARRMRPDKLIPTASEWHRSDGRRLLLFELGC
jgi:hypothetical protein